MGRIRVLRQPLPLLLGLRLHLAATLGGLPVALALTGAKAGERHTLLGILTAGPALAAGRPGQTLIAGRQYYGTEFEAALATRQLRLLRPARNGEQERAARLCSSPYAKPSSRSTRPSKPSLTSNDTAATSRSQLLCW